MESGFYNVSHEEKRGTPYAPTIVSSNDVYFDNCPKCGRGRFNKENRDLSLVIEGKRKLPDYLLCGHSSTLKIVSQRVVDVWQKYEITGYTAFPISKLLDKHGNEVHAESKYYNLIITGRIELDFERMGVFIMAQCSTCGGLDYNKKTWENWGVTVAKEGSYTGTDLFVANRFEAAPICTRKMLEIVHKEKLTNFSFTTFESKFSGIGGRVPIDLKTFFKTK